MIRVGWLIAYERVNPNYRFSTLRKRLADRKSVKFCRFEITGERKTVRQCIVIVNCSTTLLINGLSLRLHFIIIETSAELLFTNKIDSREQCVGGLQLSGWSLSP